MSTSDTVARAPAASLPRLRAPWRSLAALLRFELATQRNLVVVAGLVGAALAVASFWIPRNAFLVATGTGPVFGAVTAALLGASMLTSELVGSRMSFLLTQPLSPAVVWWGKVLSSSLLAICCQLLTSVPTVLARTLRGVPVDADGARLWLTILCLLPLVVVLGNVVGTWIRIRSIWIVADLLAGGTVALLVGITLGHARTYGTEGAERFVALVGVLLAFSGSVVGGRLQVGRGGVEPGRAHRWLSTGVWGVVLSGLAVLALWSAGWTRVDPDRLAVVSWEAPARGGSWLVVRGEVHRWLPRPFFLESELADELVEFFDPLAGGEAWFLQSLDGARRIQLPWNTADPTFTADGGILAFDLPTEDRRGVAVRVLDLRGLDPRGRRLTGGWTTTPIELPEPPFALEVSPNGALIALVTGRGRGRDRLEVREVDTGRILLAHRSNGGFLRWLDDDSLRLYSFPDGLTETWTGLRRTEDPRYERVETSPGRSGVAVWRADGERFLSRTDDEVTLHDAGGTRLGTYRPPDGLAEGSRVRFVGEHVLLLEGDTVKRLSEPSLEVVHQAALPPGNPRIVGAVIDSDTVLVAGSRREEGFDWLQLDLEDGTLRPASAAVERLLLLRDPPRVRDDEWQGPLLGGPPGTPGGHVWMRWRREALRNELYWADFDTGESRRLWPPSE